MDEPSSAGIAVVICCYTEQRWDDVLACIAATLSQRRPVAEIVVVVDHNERLFTRLAARFGGRSCLKLVVNDGQRGLSAARNTGIATTTAPLVLFLDDDACPSADLAGSLQDVLAEPAILGAMARITPSWRGARPRWFPDEFLWTIGCTYRGLRGGRVRNLIGAAMLVRRSVFEKVGGFSSDLGRDASSLPLGCEETELCLRAVKRFPGGYFFYDEGVECAHKVGGERLGVRYFLKRCYAEGLSKARLKQAASGLPALASERRFVLVTLPVGVLRECLALTRGDVAGPLRAFMLCAGFGATLAGYALARMRLRLRPPGAARLARPVDQT